MTERYEIIATLLTASPLAIHGGLSSHDLKAMGLMEPNAPFRAKTDVHEALEDCDALVVRDWRGLPYIPGSSLKGVIREYLERDKNHAQLLKSLLGTATSASSDARDARDNQVTQGDQGAQNDRGGEGGCVTFEDAFLDLAPRNEPAFSTQERSSPQGTGCHEEIAHRWNQWESAIHNGSVGNAEMMKFEEDIWKAEDCFPDNLWRAETTPPRPLTDARLLPYWSPRTLTYVEQHTSVDRRTGTVHDGGLYNEEVVPAGLPFVVRMLYEVPKSPKSSATDGTGDQSECVTTTSGQEGLKLLLQALASFNLDPIHAPPQLGSNSRHGWGLMTCLPSTVQIRRLIPDDYAIVPAGEPNPVDVLKELLKSPPSPRRPRLALKLELRFNSPFLTLDPAKSLIAAGIAQEFYDKDPSDARPERKGPDHVPRVVSCRFEATADRGESAGAMETPTSPTGRPLLPAAGFKGAFRSQLEKILRTIHPGIPVSPHGQLEPVEHDRSPLFVRHLLGMESQQSGLWCSDFIGQRELPLQQREMVAIDRFTGGVAGSAKFNCLAFQSPTLEGMLVIELPTAEEMQRLDSSRTPEDICREHPELVHQMLGGMVLVLRDLIEGDIAFGYGDRKGFGQCTARVRKIEQTGLSKLLEGCIRGETENQSRTERPPRSDENPQETAAEPPQPEVLSNQWLATVLAQFNQRLANPDPTGKPDQSLLDADYILNKLLTSIRASEAFPARSRS